MAEWDWTDITSGVGIQPDIQQFGFACDPINRFAIMGGTGNSWDTTGTTYRFDVDTETFTSHSGIPPGTSWNVQAPVVFWDHINERITMFGGLQGGANNFLNTVWYWNDTTKAWVTVGTTGGPPQGRSRAAWAVDTNRDSLVIFGGQSWPYITMTQDPWYLNLNTFVWSQPAVTGDPTGGAADTRYYACMEYDPNGDKHYLWGGAGASAGYLLNDFWELDPVAGTWTNVYSSVTQDKGPYFYTMLSVVKRPSFTFYHATLQEIIAIGGWDGNTNEWDMEVWRIDPATLEITGQTCGGDSVDHRNRWFADFGFYLQDDDKVYISSGRQAGAAANNTWTFEVPPYVPPIPPLPPATYSYTGISVVVIAKDLLRVKFSETMAVDDNLRNLSNWVITSDTPGAIEINVEETRGFEADAAEVDFVDLKISRGTKKATYSINVTNLKTANGDILGDVEPGEDDTSIRRLPATSDCVGNWAMDGADGTGEPDASDSGLDLAEIGTVPAVEDNPFSDGTTSRNYKGLAAHLNYLGNFDAALGTVFDGHAGLTVVQWIRFDDGVGWAQPWWLDTLALKGPGADLIEMRARHATDQGGPYQFQCNVRMTGLDVGTLATGYEIEEGWRLVVVTVDGPGEIARLFVDAVEVGTAPCSGVTDNSIATSFAVGSSPAENPACPGLCSHSAIYSTVKGIDWVEELLTPPEVTPGVDASFVYQPTKTDSILSTLPSMYGKSLGSNVRQVLSAMGISDEEIGGQDSAILPSDDD